MSISFIANTGIHFYNSNLELKPSDGFVDAHGDFVNPISITEENGFEIPIVFTEYYEPLKNMWGLGIAASFSGGQVVNLENLRKYMFTDDNGNERIVDESKIAFGNLPIIAKTDYYSEFCFAGSINSRIRKGECPLDSIENEWLPIPMFEVDGQGKCMFGPVGWCRMKMVPISKVKNVRRYHIVWAFDTNIVRNEQSLVRPYFYDGENEKHYTVCNDAKTLFGFFAKSNDCEWVDDYIAQLIHGSKTNTVITVPNGPTMHFYYVAYYITILSYLKKIGVTPEVLLYSDMENMDESSSKPIDLVLDIGNSRTCGVLFEDADFTKVDMLQLQDMSEPWKTYRKPFDMRLAFHRCSFGEMDIPDQFNWQSFLRIGDEAIKLIYKSRPADGVAQLTNNYSSPKRYLWDGRQFDGQWDFLTTDEETSLVHYINIKGLSEQFASDGSLRRNEVGGIYSSFSRRSLMTFVMIEIFQQALMQINSIEYRERHKDVNIPRKLRRIIITCPTAMPKDEQIILRQCAEEAFVALTRCKDRTLYEQSYDPKDWENIIQVIPSVKDLSTPANSAFANQHKLEWGYDEATCCQLVYLYAEITQRYLNHCEDFFNLYGHKRKEFENDDYNHKSLTVGSLDIGAGTTDLMICAYKYDEKGVCKLTPKPLFWDSFYYAGDDILEEIVRTFIIEGSSKKLGAVNEGPIFNAVCSSYMALDDEAFIDALNLRGKISLRDLSDTEKKEMKFAYAARETSERIHNFFGKDRAIMDYSDRQIRQDFNIQISVPMGLKVLDFLRTGRTSMQLHYEDFFDELQPAQFVIDHFNQHFSLISGGKTYVSIDFKKIVWNFDNDYLSNIIIRKVDPLMKQMAIVLNKYHCDIILLAGKPTSLDCITDLFLKYLPTYPNRLIRLNDYRVGEWYPFADGLGYFRDQKSLVAVGAMIGYLSSNGGIDGFHMDMSHFKKDMVSTADYIGLYNSVNQKITDTLLTPDQNNASFEVHGFPLFLGCKQLHSPFYQARPLYSINLADGIDLHTVQLPLKVSVMRQYSRDKEDLKIVSAVDAKGKPFGISNLVFQIQSLATEGSYWLDKGEFVLSING